MAQKTVWIAGIGELTLSKRRGSRNLRLSINAKGQIRVGLPAWAPYSAGINFALSRKDWIEKHQAQNHLTTLKDSERIGKSYQLKFIYKPEAERITTRISGNEIIISGQASVESPQWQSKARAAAERALKTEAQALLPQRLDKLARANNFSYHSLRIKKLSSRWGSCSASSVITLNYFLMQLPWELIDYVMLHELVHTRHLNHSPAFWSAFEQVLPDAKAKRRQVNTHRPVINSVGVSMA